MANEILVKAAKKIVAAAAERKRLAAFKREVAAAAKRRREYGDSYPTDWEYDEYWMPKQKYEDLETLAAAYLELTKKGTRRGDTNDGR